MIEYQKITSSKNIFGIHNYSIIRYNRSLLASFSYSMDCIENIEAEL